MKPTLKAIIASMALVSSAIAGYQLNDYLNGMKRYDCSYNRTIHRVESNQTSLQQPNTVMQITENYVITGKMLY